MTWIYSFPVWIMMPAVLAVCCAITIVSLVISRSYLMRNDRIAHNDVAGPILGAVGTILAVLMSLMVVQVWQEYDAAAQTAQAEASALSDLYHMTDAMPQPWRGRIKRRVDAYIVLVLREEWPMMRRGLESRRAFEAAYAIQDAVARYGPRSSAQAAVQAQALDYVQRMLDARRQRILDNVTGIPPILWATMAFASVVTIGLTFYFRVQPAKAQYIMSVALTLVIGTILVLIAELDYPFRGDAAIRPTSLQHVNQTDHNLGLTQP